MKKILTILILLIPLLAHAQNKAERQEIISKTNVEVLEKKSIKAYGYEQTDKEIKIVNGKEYKVIRGPRPPIDYEKVQEKDYESAVLQIKIKPEKASEIPFKLIKASSKGYVETGIAGIDRLNKEFGANQYRPALWGLYQIKSKSLEYKDRHKAWGFHLWYKVTVSTKTDIIAAIKKYQALDEVEIAEPIFKKRLYSIENDTIGNKGSKWTPNDTRYNEQWHYQNTAQTGGTVDCDIDLPEAWNIETGHSDVIVAIMDEGVQYDHPDIIDNMWPTIGPEGTTTTAGDHGTHVGGTVAAITNNGTGVAGVAGGTGAGDGTLGSGDGARLMTLDLFNGPLTYLEMATYAADNGAAISQNSWGYGAAGNYVQNEIDAIDYFNTNGGGSVLNGGITIFAAGNDNDNGEWWPGYYSEAMSVAATTHTDEKAWYSNYGSWLHISAPGGETATLQEGVLSTLSGDSYDFYQGTSMACPHVSGAAAVVVSYAHRNGVTLTNTELWNILVTTTDDHYPQNPSYTGDLGSGRLNLYNALLETDNYLATDPPEIISISDNLIF